MKIYVFESIENIEFEGTIVTKCIEQHTCQFNYQFGTSTTDGGDPGYLCNVSIDKNYLLCFDIGLIDYKDGKKVTYINHNLLKKYEKKGIPEAIIPELSRILKCPIYSSTNDLDTKGYDTEARVSSATKYWERIIRGNSNSAFYDKIGDIFYCHI